MFVSRTTMQQDRRVIAPRSPRLVRPFRALIVSLFLLLFVAAGPASAEPPLEVNGPVTDNAKVLGSDEAKVTAALKDFTRQTGFHLYVVYVKSFDGLTGTDWAEKTAAQSAIGSTDILLAVSASDNHYGLAEPRDHGMSEEAFSAVAANDIRPAVNTGDWAGAAVAAAKGYQQASEDSGLPWTLIVSGILVVMLAGALVVHRTRERYDETHIVRDEHGHPIDPLELLDTDELIDKAQFCVAAIDDPELKNDMAKELSDLLSTDLKRTDDVKRTLAINIVHRSKKPETVTPTEFSSDSGVRL